MEGFYDTGGPGDDDDFGGGDTLINFEQPSAPPASEPMGWVETTENPFASEVDDFKEPEAPKETGFFADEDSDEDIEPVAEADANYPWKIGWWQVYFNVNTNDVIRRSLRSLWPFTKSYFDSIKENPDLWGPFWICSTLIFLVTATGELGNFIHAAINGGAALFQVNAAKLALAGLVIYGYWLIVPLFLWAICRCKGVPIALVEAYTVYGYSLFIYLPVSVAAIFPQGGFEWIAWLLIMVACAWSTMFLVLAFFFPIKQNWPPGVLLLIPVAAFHVGLALGFKLYFFNFSDPVLA